MVIKSNHPTSGPMDTNSNGRLPVSMDHSPSKRVENSLINSSERVRGPQNENVELDDELTKQTKKILEEFLKRSLQKKANGTIHEKPKSLLKDGHSGQPERVQVDGRVKGSNTLQQRQREADQRKLQDLVTGRYRSPTHQESNASIVGSDCTDSGRVHRSGSFARAQRHSIVTELENQCTENEVPKRRNSENIQAEPQCHESSVTEASSRSDNRTSSVIAHGRASSDPVAAQHTTAPRLTPKKEGKGKKSWLPKLHPFKKKREGHKIRSSKDSTTPVEPDIYGPPVSKFAKTPSDHNFEIHSTRGRATPTPPASPKRTPKLLRRLSTKFKGSHSKLESPSAQPGVPASHHSFEDLIETANSSSGAKSKSLPKEVNLSTQFHHTSDPKHRVVIDGSHRHKKHKDETQRPTTLDLPKKKPSIRSKIKRFFIESSSSSSSSSIVSSCSSPDLSTVVVGTVTDGASMDVPVGQPNLKGIYLKSHSKPPVGNVRGQYHHSASKSMSDMDSQERNLSVIAAKLKSIADALQQTQYSGPSGRTQTPDSYHQDHRTKDDRSPGVNRSKSTPANTKASSMALKAYHNMNEVKTRGAEFARRVQYDQRITRDDVCGQRLQAGGNWSERVEAEKHHPAGVTVIHTGHQRQAADAGRRSSVPVTRGDVGRIHRAIPKSGQSPSKSHGRGGMERSRTEMPAPLKSVSPTLRSSRVTTDGGSSRRLAHFHSHVEKTEIARSPTGTITRRFSQDLDIRVQDVVEADVVPFPEEDDDKEPGFAEGLPDQDDDDDARETTRTIKSDDLEHLLVEAPPRFRPRAETAPTVSPFNELDNVSDDERGAVGGVDEHPDEDKLVDEIVKALIDRGDKLNEQLDMEMVENIFRNSAVILSEDAVKRALTTAMSRVYDNVNNYRHPEVVELAVIFNLVSLLRSIQPTVSGLFNSTINQILYKFGGWVGLESSIDETNEEIRNLGKGGTKDSKRHERKHDKDDSDLD